MEILVNRSSQNLRAEKIIKKIHDFNIGDEVSFIINHSARGDRMIADCIEFKYNNALDNLLNKSTIENRFVGYLKKVEENYFVKETGSYILLPLKLSPWEKKPLESNLNEPLFFKLENTDKPGKVTAAPFKSIYIPEYITAMGHFKNKTPVDAIVYKVSQHGIFVNLLGGKIQAKLPLEEKPVSTPLDRIVKIGNVIKVVITYLGSTRIVIERYR